MEQTVKEAQIRTLQEKKGFDKLKEMTSSDIIAKIVNKNQSVNTISMKFLKRFNGIIHEFFCK